MRRIRGTSSLALLAVLLSSVLSLPACGDASGSGDGNKNEGPNFGPEFLTPVAEVQEAGVRPFWLGEKFDAQPLTFSLHPAADLISPGGHGPGLHLNYSASIDGGFVVFTVETFSERVGGAAEAEEATAMVEGSKVEDVQVGPWSGRLYSLPTPNRPINQLVLFVDIDDSVVLLRAASGETGIPGDDPNPLIDAELLLQVVERNLRPYPE